MRKTALLLSFVFILICACAGGSAVKEPETIEKPTSKDDVSAGKSKKTEELEVRSGGKTGADDAGLFSPPEPKTMDKDYSAELKKSSPERTASEVSPARKNGGASASGLKASFSDDNKQYGYFIKFLEDYKGKSSSD